MSLVDYAKTLGFEEVLVSEEQWVGNLQWDYKGAKFNLRLTGDTDTDLANLENAYQVFMDLEGKEIIQQPPTRNSGGGGQRQAPRQQQTRQAPQRNDQDCEYDVTDDGIFCRETGNAFKYVPGGKAKRSGKPFPAFYSCTTRGHNTTVNASVVDGDEVED